MIYSNHKVLSKLQKEQIRILWNQEYPERVMHSTLTDFENYLQKLTDTSHVILTDGSNIIQGWYVDFHREEEKWFAIVLNSEFQGKGYGTQLLNLAKKKEIELNGWVIDNSNDVKSDGSIYKSPLAFYLKNGFELLSDIRLETEKLSAVKIRWNR